VRVDHPELTSLAAFVIGSAEEFCSRFASGEPPLAANFWSFLRKSG